MSITGVVRDVWQESWGDDPSPCWAVEITPDRPQRWANHPTFRTPFAIPQPIRVGDRVTVPAGTTDGHVTLPDGTRLRMLGGLFDRDEKLH